MITLRQVSGDDSAGTSKASTAASASEHRDVGHTKNGTGGQTAPSGVASPTITRRTAPKKRQTTWNEINLIQTFFFYNLLLQSVFLLYLHLMHSFILY